MSMRDYVRIMDNIEKRAEKILIKLLDRIEKLIDSDKLSPVEAYEALCRAEASRSQCAQGPLGT
jgi:hypothetical protein